MKRQSAFGIPLCLPEAAPAVELFLRHFNGATRLGRDHGKGKDGTDGTAPTLRSYLRLKLRFQFRTKTALPTTALRDVTNSLSNKGSPTPSVPCCFLPASSYPAIESPQTLL